MSWLITLSIKCIIKSPTSSTAANQLAFAQVNQLRMRIFKFPLHNETCFFCALVFNTIIHIRHSYTILHSTTYIIYMCVVVVCVVHIRAHIAIRLLSNYSCIRLIYSVCVFFLFVLRNGSRIGSSHTYYVIYHKDRLRLK